MDSENTRDPSSEQCERSEKRSESTEQASSAEARERLLLISKLFVSFSPKGDPKAAAAAYLEDTSLIPLPWLREGLRSFRDEPGREFVPSVAEVRGACARAVRRHRREALGQPSHESAADLEIKVPEILAWAVKNVPLGIAQMHAACAGEKRARLTRGADPTPDQGPRTEGAQPASEGIAGIIGGLERGAGGTVRNVVDQAAEIWRAGILVPARDHPDKAHSLQGHCLASMLVYHGRGIGPPLSMMDDKDWDRYDRVLSRHAEEVPAAEVGWWDEYKARWRRGEG